MPKSGLWRLAELDENFGTPYWAYDWGGGLALARHILNDPGLVAGRTVLDLGAGSEIVGIAAIQIGSPARDRRRYRSLRHRRDRLECAANGVEITACLGDPTGGAPPSADLILAGDLFYEEELAKQVTAFLGRCLEAGIDILIGDPWRAFLPRERLQLLAEYPGTDFGHDNRGDPKWNAVFSFKAA